MAENTERLRAALEGRYRIEGELGEGGMATVYLAVDLKHERKVALKILKPELAAVVGGDRFLQEIKVTANLQHPHILPLHDSGTADGMVYYVMPFVEGESLRDRLDREKQLPVEEAVRIAVAVASALDYAHRRDVVHRDIKPANILLQDGEPVVADFGIAIAVNAAGGSRLTETGLSIGTPHYMSPEQASGDRQLDGRSDIYALAAMLYEMLTGDPPFTGSTAQSVLAKILTEKPKPAREIREATPVHVALALQKALAKLPADRFATAGEFVRALQSPESVIAATSGAARGDGASGKMPRRWGWLAAATAAAGLVLGLAAAGLLRPPVEPQVLRVTLSAQDHPEILSIGDPSGRGPPAIVTPDGRTVVFVGVTGDGQRLYRRDLDSYEIVALAGTEGAYSPSFTPDGASILFQGSGGKSIVPVEGGVARVVASSWTYPINAADDGYAYGTAGTDGAGNLERVLLAGGDPELVAPVDSGMVFFQPTLLPDGRTLIASLGPFIFNAEVPAASWVVTVDVGSGEVTQLTPGFAPTFVEPGFLVFFREGGAVYAPFDPRRGEIVGPVQPFMGGGGLVAFGNLGLSRSGHLVFRENVEAGGQLVWVDLLGTEQGTVGPVGAIGSIDISPDGSQIAVGLGEDIWVYSVEAGVPPLRLTFGENAYDHPSWTPDGRSILMRGGTGAGADVYRIRADGTGSPELLRDEEVGVFRPSAGPDGFTFYQDFGPDASSRDIFAAMDGWDDARPVVATPANERGAEISPDGRWLAYVSDVTGTDEVYVTRFPDGQGRWPVSNGGGWEPVWHPDGTRLFFRTDTEYRVAEVGGDEAFRVHRIETLFGRGSYASSPNIRRYDVAPGGTRLLMTRGVRGAMSLQLVLNWSRGLSSSR